MPAREALQDYLKSGSTDYLVPKLIEARKSRKKGPGIQTNLVEGSLLVRHGKRPYVIDFRNDDRGFVNVSPGSYELVGYRIRREEKAKTAEGSSSSSETAPKDSIPWFVSTTGPSGKKFLVQPDLTHNIKIDADIRVNLTAKKTHSGVYAQLTLRNWREAPLTLYRNGVRVSLPYSIRDDRGKEVAQGKLAYG